MIAVPHNSYTINNSSYTYNSYNIDNTCYEITTTTTTAAATTTTNDDDDDDNNYTIHNMATTVLSPPTAINRFLPSGIIRSNWNDTIQRTLAWPLRKDDTHTSRSVNNFISRFLPP